jgi:hypothetical protein
MTLQTFGPVLVQDPRTKKGVPVTTAVVTNPATGDPVATYDLDGNARSVTTDSRGIASQWQADAPSNGVIALDFGGIELQVISLTATVGLSARMDAIDAMNASTRLSDLEARVAALEAGGGGSSGTLIITDNGAGQLSTSSVDVSDPGTGVLSTSSTDVSDPGTGVLSAA